jgi:hypothetical protein
MGKNQPLTLELFGKALNRLIEMVVLGKAHIKIGRGLGQALSDDPAIAYIANVFWGMSMTAHLDVAQLIAFKLFDTHHGTMTIHYLLENAEDLKTSFHYGTPAQVEAVVEIARTQISSALTDPLRRIRAKRNRVLAHVDPTIIRKPEKLVAEVAVTFSDLNLILSIAGSILNELSVKLRDTSPLYDMLDSDDYKTVIDLVTDAKCAQIRAYEAEFGAWTYARPKKCSDPV